MHASTYGTIPDHCIAYALSDPKDVHLRNYCDHNHDDSCSQCELLKPALTEIRDAISEAAAHLQPSQHGNRDNIFKEESPLHQLPRRSCWRMFVHEGLVGNSERTLREQINK